MPIQGLISLQTLNSMGAETVHSLVTIPSLWKDVYNKRKVCHAAKSLQLCLTLCDPIDGSPPGSPVPGILQARTLQWVAISFSNAWKWKVKVKSLSHVRLLATPWTAAYQAPLPRGFSRQEDWSGVPLPSPCLSTRSLEIPPQSGWVTHTVNAQGWWFAVWLLSKTCFKGPNNIAILLMIILINGK